MQFICRHFNTPDREQEETEMEGKLRKTSIEVVGNVPWGTHFCQFYQTKEDLIDILVPYFKAGLENNEFCMWITAEPLNAAEAHKALQKKVRNLDDYIKNGQIEILDYNQLYTKQGHFDSDEVLQGWIEKEQNALKKGFDGFRFTGNVGWLKKRDWKKFANYEETVSSVIARYRMLAVCTYSLDDCSPSEIIDVVSNHQFTLIKQKNEWKFIQSSDRKKAMEAMQKSEHRYRTLVEANPNGIQEIDTSGIITYTNPAYQKMLGYTEQELLGKSILDLLDTESKQDKLRDYLSILVNEQPQPTTYYQKNRTKDNRIIDMMVDWNYKQDNEERVVGFTSVITDITESKKAEENIKSERQRFFSLLENLPAYVYLQAPDYSIRFANRYFIEHFGNPEGRLCHKVLWDREEPCKVCPTFRVLDTKESQVWEWEQAPDGRTYQIYDYPFIDNDGSQLVLELGIDITEQKRAEEALAASEVKYRSLFDNSIEGIGLSMGNRVISANKALLDIFGYDFIEEFTKIPILDHVAPESREMIQGLMEKAKKGDVLPATYEHRIICKNGLLKDIEISTVQLSKEGQKYTQSTFRDITERKKAEDALKSAKEFTETALNAQMDTFFVFDPITKQPVRWNKAFSEMTGYSDEEIASMKAPDDWYSEDDLKKAAAGIEKIYEEGQATIEMSLITRDGRRIPSEYTASLIKDVEGNPKYIISIGRDITKRKKAEEELKLHEMRLQALLDLNKMTGASEEKILDFVREEVIRITQSQFTFIGFMNADESVMIMQSWSKDTMAQCAVIDKPMVSSISEAGLWGEPVRQRKPVIVNDYNASNPVKKGFPRGHVPIERFLGVPVFDGDRIVAMAAVANKPDDYDESDIRAIESMMNDTWRLIRHKHAEEALQKSEANFRTIFNSANDAIFVHDTKNTKILSANEKACQMYGYTQEEFKKITVGDISTNEPPYSQKNAVQFIKQAVDEGPQLFEWKCKDKAGKNFWVEVNLKLATIGDRKCILAIVRDITERKQAEEALSESENRLEAFMNNSAVIAWMKDEDGRHVFLSENYQKRFDVKFDEWKGKTDFEVWPREIAERFRKNDLIILESGQTTEVEEMATNPDGSYSWWLSNKFVFQDSSGKRYVGGLGVDITERKQAEEELKKQQYYLKKAQDIGSIGTWELDIKKNKLVWTDENYRIFGVPLGTELTYEIFLDCVHPDDRAYVDKKWKAALKNKPYDIEHRLIVDGKVKWVREKAELQFDEEGNCIYGIGFTQDITERKESEEERKNLLHDMGERIKELTCMYSVTKAIQQRDTLESTFQDVAKLIPPGWHYPEITCARVSFDGSEYVSDSFKETQWKQTSDLIVDGRRRGSVEVYYLEEKPTLDEGPFLKEERQLIDAIAHTLSEAIKRMSAEEQTENLAKFPSEDPYPVLRIAKDGTVLYANSAGSDLLENWACGVGTQVPEQWRKNILRTLKSRRSENLEAVCRDRMFSLTIAPVTDSGYANLYGTDITERKQAEENLRNYRQRLEELVHIRTGELTDTNKKLLLEIEGRIRLEKEILNISEREQKRIGQELHDSIGQQFTGIAFLTKVLEQKLTGKLPDEATDAAEIKKLVNQAMDQMRSLARGLHPVNLDAGSFTSALQELATTTEKLFGIRCTFKYDKPITIDDAEVATHLYRITQEAITNAIKHGKTKNIHIELGQKKDKSVLKIENDGLDFPAEFEAKGTGMGLQIMDHRANIIGASLDIHKATQGGTIVTCSFSNKTH
jgi:PAS domain S-box-containing protein